MGRKQLVPQLWLVAALGGLGCSPVWGCVCVCACVCMYAAIRFAPDGSALGAVWARCRAVPGHRDLPHAQTPLCPPQDGNSCNVGSPLCQRLPAQDGRTACRLARDAPKGLACEIIKMISFLEERHKHIRWAVRGRQRLAAIHAL